ncbi:MAG: YraN family protein [Minisyncoccia bacterium]
MYNKVFKLDPTSKQVIGEVGENFACDYLLYHGYRVIERNYLKKWGELDVIASKSAKLHIVEVKTVTRETAVGLGSGESIDTYRAEDNIHPWKLKRLGRAIQSYLLDRNVSDETEWQFDIITVYLNRDRKLLKVELLEDIVL